MTESKLRLRLVSQLFYCHPDGSQRPYQVVDLLDEAGELAEKYSRYLNEDGTKWVRHGVFQVFHQSGRLLSQGNYRHDKENGEWQDFHENGQIAAVGKYSEGKQVGLWRYWNDLGQEEQSDDFGE